MGVDKSVVGATVGVSTEFQNKRGNAAALLEQEVYVLAQGNSGVIYSSDKFVASSAAAVAAKAGYGSPAHLAAREFFPRNGDGIGKPVTFALLQDDPSGVAAAGSVDPVGTQTAQKAYKVRVGTIESKSFVVPKDATPADVVDLAVPAINAVLEMPAVAADGGNSVGLTMKWKGASGNDAVIEVIGEEAGITFGITQPTGGLVNPDVDPALAQMGGVWYPMVLNCMNVEDTGTLDKIQTVGEGRWGAVYRKPFVAFVGNTAVTPGAATAVSSTRKSDRINGQLVAPGSKALPFVVAARALARIARKANNKPAHLYTGERLTGIEPGADGDQWDHLQREEAIAGGSSTVEVVDGVIKLLNVFTFYAASDDENKKYRFVADIVKLQNLIHNFAVEFDSEAWAGVPVLPDEDSVTVASGGKKLSDVIVSAQAVVRRCGRAALVAKVKESQKLVTASFDSENPKRINTKAPVFLSPNSNVIDAVVEWSFLYGEG